MFMHSSLFHRKLNSKKQTSCRTNSLKVSMGMKILNNLRLSTMCINTIHVNIVTVDVACINETLV